MVKCPNCGNEDTTILKEWDYSRFHVKRLSCSVCQLRFCAYFRDDKFSHIIDNPRFNLRNLVIRYLRQHGHGTIEEIADATNYSETQVLSMLEKLEKAGVVNRDTDVNVIPNR